MTPAEEAVLAAARAFRDAMAEVGYADKTIGLGNALLIAAQGLPCAAEQPGPTVATVRPWPDPEAYRALAREVYGEAALPKDVPAAVAAWKTLESGARVMCARGYQWTADRAAGRLRFIMARKDGTPGKALEQPWYPLITGRLPVWPIVVEAAGD